VCIYIIYYKVNKALVSYDLKSNVCINENIFFIFSLIILMKPIEYPNVHKIKRELRFTTERPEKLIELII